MVGLSALDLASPYLLRGWGLYVVMYGEGPDRCPTPPSRLRANPSTGHRLPGSFQAL